MSAIPWERSRRNSSKNRRGFRASGPSSAPCACLRKPRAWQALARRWPCRWSVNSDLGSPKPDACLLVEVQGPAALRCRRLGCGGPGSRKRARLARAWACWLGGPVHSATPRTSKLVLRPGAPATGAGSGALVAAGSNGLDERPGGTLEVLPRPPAMTSRPHEPANGASGAALA